MPRSVKHGGKTKSGPAKSLRNQAKRKNRALKRKKQVHTECKQLSGAWNNEKTVKENMEAMGLAYDPNAVVPMKCKKVKKSKDSMEVEEVDVAQIAALNANMKGKFQKKRGKKTKPTELEIKAGKVVSELEAAAQKEAEDQKVGRGYKLQERDVEFCVYMDAKHKDDYKAMSRDPRNLWQETPKQLERKMRIYKSSEYYKALEEMDTA